MTNYRFLITETNLKALYTFGCLFTTSSVKRFVVNAHVFVYNCVFQKKENNTQKTFCILKIKAHFKKDNILRMKAHFETHSENENRFSGK